MKYKLLRLTGMSIKYVCAVITVIFLINYLKTGNTASLIASIFYGLFAFVKEILFLQVNDITLVSRFTGAVEMNLFTSYKDKLSKVPYRKSEYFTNEFIDGFYNIPELTAKDPILRGRKKFYAKTHEEIYSKLVKVVPQDMLCRVQVERLKDGIIPSKFIIAKFSMVTNSKHFHRLTRSSKKYKITVDIDTLIEIREAIKQQKIAG